MVDYELQIKELEEELATKKYNKHTAFALGLAKAKISKLKEKIVARSSRGSVGEGFAVRKTGDGTVILLGFPSVGKSTLLNSLTNAKSEVAAYAFTTVTVIPGLMPYKHAKIQILDVPGIVSGAASGRGRGKEVLACIRSADLVLMVLDATADPEQEVALMREVRDTSIRLNERKPDVTIKRTAKNGLRIGTTLKLTKLDMKTIEAILREYRINNADVVIREDISDDQLLDVIEGNKLYLPSVVVINKSDLVTPARLAELKRLWKPDLCISAQKREHIEEVKDLIFNRLRLMRIYLKEPGKDADLDVPIIMFEQGKMRDVCLKLHKDFVEKFKFARVWGKSAKFPGQKFLNLDHVLKDGDVLELHLK